MLHVSYISIKLAEKQQQWNITTHLLERPKSRTVTTPNGGEDVEQEEISFIAGGNAQWYSYFGRQFCIFTKLNILLAFDPAIMFLGIYPKELKTYVTQKPHMMLMRALFIFAKTWKQPRRPSVVNG